MSRPKLLDAYCCQGGAWKGYTDAGWDVTGVDNRRSHGRYYPGRFIVADAIEYILNHGHEYDAIHASPPCQALTRGNAGKVTKHVNLIPATRMALVQTGRPFVIENVEHAAPHLIAPTLLCWSMFREAGSVLDDDGTPLRMERHRLFEASFPLTAPRTLPSRPDGAGSGVLWRRTPRQMGGQEHPQRRLRPLGRRAAPAARHRLADHTRRAARVAAPRLHPAHRRPAPGAPGKGRSMTLGRYVTPPPHTPDVATAAVRQVRQRTTDRAMLEALGLAPYMGVDTWNPVKSKTGYVPSLRVPNVEGVTAQPCAVCDAETWHWDDENATCSAECDELLAGARREGVA